MKNGFNLLTTSALLSIYSLNAQAVSYVTYQIRPGDTIGEVLGGLGICPLWGSDKMVGQTVKLNPGIINKKGNFVLPNKRIKLPINQLEENSEYKISEHNEVYFTVPAPELKCGAKYRERKESEKQIRQVAEEKFEAPAASTAHAESNSPAAPASPSAAYGILRASTDFFYSAINATDKTTQETANILSRVNHAYQFAWEQQWNDKNRTFLFYRTEQHSYESFEEKLPAKTFNLQGFGLGYMRALTDRLNLFATARLQEKLFIRATDISTLKMERAMIPELTLSPQYRLFSEGPFNLYGDLGLGYLMASKTSNYSIRSGYMYLAGLTLTQKIKDFELMGRGFYSMEKQDSSIMEKTTKNLGVSLGVAWSFGK